jgi:transposase-like protein
MNKSRKKWSAQEKLEVLVNSQKEGVTRTSRQYGISTTMIYNWQKKYEEEGESGLISQKAQKDDMEKNRLLRENRELKAIVAEKEMQLRIQEVLLKKNQLLHWKSK